MPDNVWTQRWGWVSPSQKRLLEESARDEEATRARLNAGEYGFRDGFPWGRP